MLSHLVVDLSSHGFGHVAQTAPVVNALRRRIPELRLTLRGQFPVTMLQTRFEGRFELIPQANDIGMLMTSALDLLVEESAQAYERFHALWPRRLEHDSRALSALRPDLLIANVPYLSIAAAAQAGIPAVAMCSLNWSEIYAHYCGHLSGAEIVRKQIDEAYRCSDTFIRITPGLPMHDLPKVVSVGPIAALGTKRRSEIEEKLGLAQGERLVLVALGGIATRLPMEAWPAAKGIRWLVPDDWNSDRPDTLAFSQLQMPFTDMLASSDAVLTKPGYGTFVEAACNGVPVLSVARPDWPEEVYLRDWLTTHGALEMIHRDRLSTGALLGPLQRLFSRNAPTAVSPSGVEAAADYLARRFGG